ncbi:MAG: ferrous iron transport protein A [Candidatus Omnitrophica bacterium]|nr:ferrous iron transport protein A [Candidatus Omnitrophota bacterium]
MYLTELRNGQTAVVKDIEGGGGAKDRLESLGIMPEKKITKISSHFWGGPVTVMIGKTKVAIGHGMAKKIIVEN